METTSPILQTDPPKIGVHVNANTIRVETPFGIVHLDTKKIYAQLRITYAKERIETILEDKGYPHKQITEMVDTDFVLAWLRNLQINDCISECEMLAVLECVDMKQKGELALFAQKIRREEVNAT